ncbi:hypothetical protein PGB90_003150 [Kerria lacca]
MIVYISNEVSPAHRHLKYRRLSDAKQKEVHEKFLQICDDPLLEDILQYLRLPSFDCSEYSDEEILLILQYMYLHFDFPVKYNINMTTLRNFLFQVYKNYNEVPFHNFRHSFCVTQMMYAMILKVDLSKLIDDLEILVLITSCICHDLDHPGYNNLYQVNARTELALRYNDISPLENHHCSVAFHILDLPDANIFENFSSDMFRTVREGIIRCILATDMARHNEILTQFRDAVTEGFDFKNQLHINLLCMILIKVADISNEARPMNVAEPWLDKLFKEFFTQSDTEKKEGLPVTPFMDRDKITKPSSQCSFIGYVLLPLFEALVQLFPELNEMIVYPVRYALDYYRKLNEAVKDEQRQQRKSVVTLDAQASTITSPSSPGVANSIQAQLEQGMLQQKSEEETSILSDEGGQSMVDLTEEEEEETKTEVAVSEKTLKFKISTERVDIKAEISNWFKLVEIRDLKKKVLKIFINFENVKLRSNKEMIKKKKKFYAWKPTHNSGVRSHPGSRKGSREKAQDFEITRAYRFDRTNRTSESGADKRSWSSSENTSSYEDKRSDNNSYEKRYHTCSPTTAIPEGSGEFPNALLSDKLKKLNEEAEQPKPQSSSTRSPDLKRFMNRVVRDFRGNKSKVANGVKNTEDSSSKSDSKCQTNANRSQHKEPKSPSWMSALLQNIKLRTASHETDSQ